VQQIRIRGARQHNLQNIDVILPRHAFVTVSGVSGSGKSSLVFDTLYAEGQRRYVESLSNYTKQFLERIEKPDVDEISGISPAVAIRQQNTVKSSRSTVGTATEVSDHLRLVFARAGIAYCPECNDILQPQSPSQGARRVLQHFSDGARLLVVFEVQRSKDYNLVEFLESIRAAGFVRLWHQDKTLDLDPLPKLPARTPSIAVVADRIVARSEATARLSEALETAYRAGGGRASVIEAGGADRLVLTERAECPKCDISLGEITPALFSFNNPLGACPECRGFGNRLEFDERLIIAEPDLTLAEGALVPWATPKFEYYFRRLETYCRKERIPWNKPWCELPRKTQELLLEGAKGYKGILPFLEALKAKTYKKYARFFTRRFMDETTCRACRGTRLRREALSVRVGGEDIAALSSRTIGELRNFVEALDLQGEAAVVAADVMTELRNRLAFLCQVGLDYLSLDRLTRTLSGGEAQRINLGSALGAHLVDALYVLDEPTAGMHARDTERLIATLRHLRDLGNSVVVVEHDPEVIAASDWLVDMGPGAGTNGGKVVYAGPPDGTAPRAGFPEAVGDPLESRTMSYLRGELEVTANEERRAPGQHWIEIDAARMHNLKSVDLRLPVGRLICVSGVSGSGKSTLITEVLYKAMTLAILPQRGSLGSFSALRGAHLAREVLLVEATPIGKTPRSNPVSYMKAFSEIRNLFCATRDARLRRLTPGHFSFNTKGGRCEACEGMGAIQVEMHFMADLYVRCEHCEGQRYQPEVLEVQYRGRNIAEVLEMTVEEALTFFHDSPVLGSKLYVLKRAGLGYLRLGQAAPTLSGGESQRLKIARALASKPQGSVLYIFDEPTNGLHLQDVSRLLRTLQELVDRGHTVLVIEHHLDIIQAADWVIDLGPEAGDAGGEIVYAGPPDGLMRQEGSHTGRALRRMNEARANAMRSVAPL
jgi:excinuclease ABC subunit A